MDRNNIDNKTHFQLVEQLVTSELELAAKGNADSNTEPTTEQCEVQQSAASDNVEGPKSVQEETSSNEQIITEQVRFYVLHLCTVPLLRALSLLLL